MIQNLTLSNEPLEHPGMDFAFLREEGIKHIQRLAGHVWTDHNLHDPGITILEQLCYVITDLSYRLSFDLKDLLADPSGRIQGQYYTPKEILTNHPVTMNDYRKLIIDLEGVKNAWLEKIENPIPELYYDPENHVLGFDGSASQAEPVRLKGLYRVLIEKEDGVTISDSDLENNAASLLHPYRNLCEDFAEIRVLPTETIHIKAEIDMEEGLDVNQVMAEIYVAVGRFISPGIRFHTLGELLDQGKPVEDIFNGPVLTHGFIDDEELSRFQKKTELHVSDLTHIILDIEGVRAVRSIFISDKTKPKDNEWQEWALPLSPGRTPKLKKITDIIKFKGDDSFESSSIKFYNGRIEITGGLNKNEVQSNVDALMQSAGGGPSTYEDIPIPSGEYRDLDKYISVQNEFPINYGIGETGLYDSATDRRKAQAKQLQAYLMFFDQLLADYFSQLAHVKDLLSFQNPQDMTYFPRECKDVPGAAHILGSGYNQPMLQIAVEENDTKLERKNRFLDHLMAMFCETFTDYSLLLYPPISDPYIHIETKAAFLKDYPKISAGRARAFDYKEQSADNVSTLKKRICAKLGISDASRRDLHSLSGADAESFHVVEHILLRRKTEPSPPSPFMTLIREITKFSDSSANAGTHTTCTSPGHGLEEDQQINLFDISHYNGIYRVTNVQADTFDIEELFSRNEQGKWVRSPQYADPYSFQLSFVFPDWPNRFKNDNFKQLVYETILSETPAHITPHIHWLNKSGMQGFEDKYKAWLQKKATNATGLDVAADGLAKLLKIHLLI